MLEVSGQSYSFLSPYTSSTGGIRTRKTDSGSEIVIADNGRGFAPANDNTQLDNLLRGVRGEHRHFHLRDYDPAVSESSLVDS